MGRAGQGREGYRRDPSFGNLRFGICGLALNHQPPFHNSPCIQPSCPEIARQSATELACISSAFLSTHLILNQITLFIHPHFNQPFHSPIVHQMNCSIIYPSSINSLQPFAHPLSIQPPQPFILYQFNHFNHPFNHYNNQFNICPYFSHLLHGRPIIIPQTHHPSFNNIGPTGRELQCDLHGSE